MMDVRLPDGTVIKNVPDGTSKEELVTKLQAKGYDTSWYQPASTEPPVSQDFIQRSARTQWRAENPVKAAIADVAASGTEMTRGVMGKLFPEYFKTPEGLVNKGSGASLAGSILAPEGFAVGMGAGKVAQTLPKLGQFGKNVAAGVIGGGAVGGLSEDGSVGQGAVTGGVVSAAIPGIAKVAGKGIDLVRGRGSDIRAGRIMREAGGPDLAQRLAAAPSGPLNVAQAYGADAPVALAGLQRFADQRLSGAQLAKNIADRQEAARRAGMQAVAGGGSAEASAATRAAEAKALRAATNPMRVTELNAANEANRQLGRMLPQVADKRASEIAALQGQGRAATESAQQRVLGENFQPVLGQPRFPSRYAPQTDRAAEYADTATDFATIKSQRLGEREFIERKIGSLEQYGLRPLTADPILATIRSKVMTPGNRATSMVQDVLGGIEDAIARASKANGGVLDAYDLHAIRKYEINSVIDKLTKDAGKSDKALAASLAADVRKAIDTAIEKAGGTEWKTYLNKYRAGMHEIDKMKMASQAMNLPEERLISLVAGNEPKMVKKVFGDEATTFAGEMGQQAAPFKRAADELARDRALKESASAGSQATAEILTKNLFGVNLPNLLNQNIALMNRALTMAESRLNKSTVEKLSKAMNDPRKAMQIIQTLPLEERNTILRAMQDPRVTGAAAGMLTGATQ